MTKQLTDGVVVSELRNLLYMDPAYMWGANGEYITPELIQKLQNRYVSNNHTPEYYDEKLKEYRGKVAVDDIGMLNFLSVENRCLQDYVSNAKQVIPAIDITQNQVWILYNAKVDGVSKIGVYLGNGNVIVAAEGYPGMREVQVELSNWTMAFLPDFMKRDPIWGPARSSIMNYQRWLNDNAASRGIGTVSNTGHYDTPTKTLSLLIAKQQYGELVGTSFDITANITMNEITSEIGRSFKLGYSVDDYACLLYIIAMRLYIMGVLPEFISVWGNEVVDPIKDFGIRLSAVRRALEAYLAHNRYLDSTGINLPLLRELFCDVSN